MTTNSNLFGIDQREKVLVQIDADMLHTVFSVQQRRVDYMKLLDHLHCKQKDDDPLHYVIDVHYYAFTSVKDDGHSPMQALYDWLQYSGFRVAAKPRVRELREHFSTEITLDALTALKHVDHYILFTMDINLIALLRHLRSQCKRVTLVAPRNPANNGSSHGAVLPILRQAAHSFVDTTTLIERFAEPFKEKA